MARRATSSLASYGDLQTLQYTAAGDGARVMTIVHHTDTCVDPEQSFSSSSSGRGLYMNGLVKELLRRNLDYCFQGGTE
jgi:hypothetical protein